MFILLTILHVLSALVLIMVVLLQSGKAGDLASAFGGTSSQTAFGVRSATTVLTKATAAAAIVFMVTSLGLAIFYSRASETSIMEQAPVTTQQQTTPAQQPSTPPASEGGTSQQASPPASGSQPASPSSGGGSQPTNPPQGGGSGQ
ncbi:MAG: preprotein translocase subunit SecG [Acidobacteriota bacterium]|jgi:preprotein translocase subunit SecG